MQELPGDDIIEEKLLFLSQKSSNANSLSALGTSSLCWNFVWLSLYKPCTYFYNHCLYRCNFSILLRKKCFLDVNYDSWVLNLSAVFFFFWKILEFSVLYCDVYDSFVAAYFSLFFPLSSDQLRDSSLLIDTSC